MIDDIDTPAISGDLTLGIDIGGTKMSAALIDRRGTVVELRGADRPSVPDEMVTAPVELARDLMTDDVKAIGLGVAGLVRADEGVLVWGPNVVGTNVAFSANFEREFGLPTAVDNDATVAGLAETRVGAAVGYRHVAMVTIGTGIGGGWMVDGARYHGRGFAGEIGHMIVDVGGPVCACGQRGCWETLASGRRLDEMAREIAMADPDGLIARLVGETATSGRHLTDAAIQGDRRANLALVELAGWLAIGLANLIAAFDPEIIVIGGGLSRAGDLLLEPTRAALQKTVDGADHRVSTPVVGATLGEHAGVVGAGLLAWEECL